MDTATRYVYKYKDGGYYQYYGEHSPNKTHDLTEAHLYHSYDEIGLSLADGIIMPVEISIEERPDEFNKKYNEIIGYMKALELVKFCYYGEIDHTESMFGYSTIEEEHKKAEEEARKYAALITISHCESL